MFPFPRASHFGGYPIFNPPPDGFGLAQGIVSLEDLSQCKAGVDPSVGIAKADEAIPVVTSVPVSGLYVSSSGERKSLKTVATSVLGLDFSSSGEQQVGKWQFTQWSSPKLGANSGFLLNQPPKNSLLQNTVSFV